MRRPSAQAAIKPATNGTAAEAAKAGTGSGVAIHANGVAANGVGH